MQENHKDLYDSIWSQEAIEENIKNMSVKQAQDLEKDAVKKEKKQEAKAEKDKKEKQVSKMHTRHLVFDWSLIAIENAFS